jgi:acyl transferase domain-containing protein
MADAELAQPLCTAIQIALVNALARCGIHPSTVVGHSSGEIAAAYASGAISVTEALIAAYYRGYVTKQQKLAGGMVALGLGAEAASAYLVDGIVVACENSPSSTTISGDLDRLQEMLKKIKQEKPDVLARELKVNMAYHSRKLIVSYGKGLLHTNLHRSYEKPWSKISRSSHG